MALQQLLQASRRSLSQTFIRRISNSKCFQHNYEGDGKTTVTLLNKDHKHLIMVDAFSTHGFRLNNGIFVIGPMAAFPRTILQWNVPSVEEMTPESISLFCLLEPKLDILVLGTGNKAQLPNPEVRKLLKSRNINTEILSTHQACAIFNFLNVEGRCVAGAFIPPTDITMYEEEDLTLLDGKNENLGPYIM